MSQHKLQRNINMTHNHISVIKQSLIIIFEKKYIHLFLFFIFLVNLAGAPAGVLLAGRRPAAKFGCRPPALKPDESSFVITSSVPIWSIL